jgi:5-methylcytosine-specific restriction endonuclease McrA
MSIMAKNRSVKYRFNQSGKERICRWCGKDVPKGKRTWCSDECVHEFMIRKDPSYIRIKVFERDKGVCAICGLDTEKFKKDFMQFFHSIPYKTGGQPLYDSCGNEFYSLGGGLKYKIAATLQGPLSQTFWEADHIVPVVEGGLEIGMDNLRTLCRFCHKVETKKLVKRLAEKRNADFKQEEK